MKSNNLIKREGSYMKSINYLVLIFVFTIFCVTSVFGELEVKPSKDEWKKMNIFFSNFSEAFVKPFEKEQICNKALIDFGIIHNKLNNNSLLKSYDSLHFKLDKKYVESSVDKYFGIKSITHETTENSIYKDGYYITPKSTGEVYVFSQVTKFVDIGNSYYIAYLNIYYAGSGFTGDPHGNLNIWKDEGDIPRLGNKMKATVLKVTSNGNSRYILVDYLEDK